jgi:nitrogen fixation/metabolism regulation signal transduction histidine kinase
MAYNSFFANILIRMLFLIGSFTGLAFLLVNTDRFFTLVFLAVLTIIQIISLIIFLNKTNRDLARFLLLLTTEDTSVIAWKDRVEKTFQGLHHSFRQVNEEINRMKLEKEQGIILLQNIVDHIQTGIFVADENGSIKLVNEEALRLFGVQGLEHLQDLGHAQPGLQSSLDELRYNTGNVLHISMAGEEKMPVLVRVSAFKLGEERLRLYSILGIKNELEANEIESWQKLTRVLAHEISNSVTPISTLGAGIHRKLAKVSRDKEEDMRLPAGLANDLLQSAQLIEKRSDALVQFMEHYQSFTRLPEPVPQEIKASVFFESIALFFKDELEQSGIKLEYNGSDTDVCIFADRALLEQAYINLIRNSVEAMAEQEEGHIILKASPINDKVLLEISDNGVGIPEDIQSQVFIPFFTTKTGGTGIGMSIVRKIIIMSGGSIRFRSTPGQRTVFSVLLPSC